MLTVTKIFKGIIRPFITIKVINIRLRSCRIKIKYRFLNKNITIGKNVVFNQNTVLSGEGTITLEDKVSIGYQLGGGYYNKVSEFQARYPNSIIVVHEDVAFNNSNFIISANKIDIGSGCRVGTNVTMMDFEAHGTHPEERKKLGKLGEIIIGKNVWIGNNVIILKNTYIGDNSVIAAGSVVLKGIYPSYSLLGGNPAKIVKKLNE